jgi:hypothetical protein
VFGRLRLKIFEPAIKQDSWTLKINDDVDATAVDDAKNNEI